MASGWSLCASAPSRPGARAGTGQGNPPPRGGLGSQHLHPGLYRGAGARSPSPSAGAPQGRDRSRIESCGRAAALPLGEFASFTPASHLEDGSLEQGDAGSVKPLPTLTQHAAVVAGIWWQGAQSSTDGTPAPAHTNVLYRKPCLESACREPLSCYLNTLAGLEGSILHSQDLTPPLRTLSSVATTTFSPDTHVAPMSHGAWEALGHLPTRRS
ncbi:hypothetical protein H8959_018062 [Pygathrix nigripes]